ncbi:MAG TPA: multidrug efflux SMR transporter [Nocardioidaceae bacterium]|nr:multidrug efflux SMR transporter [Nocardioidaceae bacterium]
MALTYVLLALAIVAEVVGTICLRLSEGFTRLIPSLAVVAGYAIAFTLLAVVLKRGLPVAVAYAIWAGAGVALVAAVGVVFLDERLSVAQVVGICLVIAGVVALEVGGAEV